MHLFSVSESQTDSQSYYKAISEQALKEIQNSYHTIFFG